MRKIRPITENDMLVFDDQTNKVVGMQLGDKGVMSTFSELPVVQKIRAALAEAASSNPLTAQPWFKVAPWAASTQYYAGQVVTGPDGTNAYMCRSPGVSAASGGPTGNGYAPITDGGVTWEWQGIARGRGVANTTATAWAANTAYAINAKVLSPDGYNIYVCAEAGNSAAAPSTGPVGYTEHTIKDGTVEWRWYGVTSAKPLCYPGSKATLTGLITNGKTIVPSISNPVFHWSGGVLENVNIAGGTPDVRGSNYQTAAAPNYQSGTGGNCITFCTDSSRMVFFGVNAVYAGEQCVVEVNGRLLDDSTFTAASLVNPGAWMLDLSFLGKNVPKKIRIYNRSGFTTFASKGVVIEPDAQIWKPGNSKSWSLTVEGDSLTQGGNSTPYKASSDWVTQFANMTGCDSFANLAQGGTGFISNNGGAKSTYIERIERLASTNADVYIIAGNHNDVSYTAQQRIDASLAYFKKLRELQPESIIVVFGTNPLQGESGGSGTILTGEQDLKAAFDLWDDDLSFFVPIATHPDGPWITGTGTVTTPANDGNKDRYYTTGDGHPIQRGQNYFAQRYYQAFSALFG